MNHNEARDRRNGPRAFSYDSEAKLRAAQDIVIREHQQAAANDSDDLERALLDVRIAINHAIAVGRRGR